MFLAVLIYASHVRAAPTLETRDVCNQGINNFALWLANYAPVSFCPAIDLILPIDPNPITQVSVTTIEPFTVFTTVATAWAYSPTVTQAFKEKRQDAEASSGGLNLGGLVGMLMDQCIDPLFEIVPTACSCLRRPVVTSVTTIAQMKTVTTEQVTATSTISAQVAVPVCATSAPFINTQWQNRQSSAQCGALILLQSDGQQFYGDLEDDGGESGFAVRTSEPDIITCWRSCLGGEALPDCIAFSFGVEDTTCDLFNKIPGVGPTMDTVGTKQLPGWAWGILTQEGGDT